MSASNEAVIWDNPLVRHLVIILVAKLALLAGLWFAFFRVPDQFLPQPDQIETHIAGPRIHSLVMPERGNTDGR